MASYRSVCLAHGYLRFWDDTLAAANVSERADKFCDTSNGYETVGSGGYMRAFLEYAEVKRGSSSQSVCVSRP